MTPESVSVPFPALVKVLAPLMTAETVSPSAALVVVNVRLPPSARLPLIVALAAPPVEVTLPPRVRVPVPVVTAPPIAPLLTVSAPIVSEKLFRS